MEDVLTEIPPPSRFLADDLDNFAARSPPLPYPFIVKSSEPHPNYRQNPNPNLLIILISPSSSALLPKTLTLSASLFLPELSFTKTSPINVYSGGIGTHVAAVGCHVGAERSKAVAKLLLGEFKAEKVVVFDSIKGENFRGRRFGDEAAVFKLETREERGSPDEAAVKGVEWLGSGSLIDGLAAAVMGECEMRRMKGTAVVDAGHGGGGGRYSVARILKELGVEVEERGDSINAAAASSSWLESDLYT